MSVYVGINRYKKINGLSKESYKYAEDYNETKNDVDNFEESGGFPLFSTMYYELNLSWRDIGSQKLKEEYTVKDLNEVEDAVYYKYLEEYKEMIEEKKKALQEIDATNATKKNEREQLWFIKRDYKLGNAVKVLLGYKEHKWFNNCHEKEDIIKMLDTLKEQEYMKKNYPNCGEYFENIKEEIEGDNDEFVYYVFVD